MPSYPLTFPSTSPATERFQLSHKQTAIESPYSGAFQSVNTASQWMLEWTWPSMRPDEAERVRAWINSLHGQEGTFRYVPRNAAASPVTNKTLAQPGYAYGNTVSVGGWTANAPSLLTVGQWFQIGAQLVHVTAAAATADANGRVTIEFEPALRANAAVATIVNFQTPSGIFRLSSSDGASFTLTPDRTSDFGTINAKEVMS